DHVKAIAQDREGMLWFGTDSGLAKYDGRRIEKISPDRMPSSRVTAVTLDSQGVLWIGTDAGAGRLAGNQFQLISETRDQPITSISPVGPNRFAITGRRGSVYICAVSGSSMTVKAFTEKDTKLLSITPERDSVLSISGAAMVDGRIELATLGRGLLEIDHDQIKESNVRPRPFFVNALCVDPGGKLWLGAETSTNDGGVYQGLGPLRLQKLASATGAVSSMTFGPSGDLWVGTEKHGVYHLVDGREVDHFTFENTAGGLRSDLINCAYIDRESVIWFGTDRGVCRFDPGSPHAERISSDPESNFIRCLYQAPDGAFWCVTNRGLFYRGNAGEEWKAIGELAGKAVYSIVQNPSAQSPGRQPPSSALLIGCATGLYSAQRSELGWTFARIDNNGTEPGENIRAICTFNGAIYVASYGRGLEQLKESTLVQFWPTDPKSRLGRDVISLHPEGKSRLWIGTAQSGVFYLDEGEMRQDAPLFELAGSAVWS
ncbi:MAG: ligand-binding sensor domain-containing protein, partial [Blastocatellia bacterium]